MPQIEADPRIVNPRRSPFAPTIRSDPLFRNTCRPYPRIRVRYAPPHGSARIRGLVLSRYSVDISALVPTCPEPRTEVSKPLGQSVAALRRKCLGVEMSWVRSVRTVRQWCQSVLCPKCQSAIRRTHAGWPF